LKPVGTLLQDLSASQAARCESERQRLLASLRAALEGLLPRGETVWIYGSLTRPGEFGDSSDLDVALERRPSQFSEYWLQGELELRLGRRVDIVLLPETRLREKIEREGLRWTL
jgi:predicted nucleotidyltransferase